MTGGRISAVAFDLDGTLVDLERFHHEAWLRAARQAGAELTWQQARRQLPNFIGGPDERVAAQLAALSPWTVPPEETLAAKRRHFDALIGSVDEIAVRAGVGDVLDRLSAGGVPMAVGTATEREAALTILRRAGLSPLFGESRVVAASDVPRLKPEPDVYLATARLLAVPPREQLVFEDSVTGMAAARAAGSLVAAVPTVQDQDYLGRVSAAGATAVFESWHDRDLPLLLDRLLADGDAASTGSGAVHV
ncbi:MAG TPA: HAD family phosphatase [Actinocrinis sp.]|nr:HAD family phosphatase [Actinocrinis sp.]